MRGISLYQHLPYVQPRFRCPKPLGVVFFFFFKLCTSLTTSWMGCLRSMQICLPRSFSTGAEGLFDVFKKPVEGAKKDGFFGFTTGALPTRVLKRVYRLAC